MDCWPSKLIAAASGLLGELINPVGRSAAFKWAAKSPGKQWNHFGIAGARRRLISQVGGCWLFCCRAAIQVAKVAIVECGCVAS